MDDESHLVFVFGASLDPQRMAERCPHATGRRPGRLPNHRLEFDRIALERDGTGYPNAAPAQGERVEGALYDVSRDDLLRLDQFEGHPRHVSRRLLAIEEGDGRRDVAWVYLATPEFRMKGLTPRADQVMQMLAGRDVLSADYVARLTRLADGAVV